MQGSDGNFYGTTSVGGAEGWGSVFKITSSGTLTTLYSFCSQSNCSDGASPLAGLVQASDGNFYGTNQYLGANDQGTVFKITPRSTLSTTYSFMGKNDGGEPSAGLVQGSDGNFYGTTPVAGASGYGTVFRLVSPRPCIVCP